jgi:hypothetical protein
MSSNDNDKAIHTAASVQHTRWGVTPPVCTTTGAETLLNNPKCLSTRESKKSTIHVDATTAEVTTTTRCKKSTPALEHPATVVGAKDKETPTLMQLKCPPEVEMQPNSTTEVTQSLSQLKDPPVFETWQHGTPDAAFTLSQFKEAPEIDMLQHATASSIKSQLKDNNDYNSCVEWAVAAAGAGCKAEYDSDINGNFEPLVVDGLKKPAATTNDNVYDDNEFFQDDTAEDNAEENMEYNCLNSTGRWGRSLSSGGPLRPNTSGMSVAKAQVAIKEWRVLHKAHTAKMQKKQRMLFGSNAVTEIEYSGVVDARLWLMSDVEVTPLFIRNSTMTLTTLVLCYFCLLNMLLGS